MKLRPAAGSGDDLERPSERAETLANADQTEASGRAGAGAGGRLESCPVVRDGAMDPRPLSREVNSGVRGPRVSAHVEQGFLDDAVERRLDVWREALFRDVLQVDPNARTARDALGERAKRGREPEGRQTLEDECRRALGGLLVTSVPARALPGGLDGLMMDGGHLEDPEPLTQRLPPDFVGPRARRLAARPQVLQERGSVLLLD